MEIRDIQVFRAVMQAGTTSKAAALLGVSQPAVSQSIRKLEAASELRLFDRVRARLVPTQEAHALMVEVDRYFTGFEVIEHRIRSLKTFGLGRLSVASLPALGTSFMPRAISEFNLNKRRVQMSFQIMSSKEVHHQVTTGQIDFGLMADEISVSGLEHSQFLSLPGVIVMNKKHPLARKKMIEAEDLVGHPFLALNPEDSSRRRLEYCLKEQGHTLRPILETPYSHSICELAMQGVGFGMAHPIQALDYVSRGLLIKPLRIEANFTALLVFRAGASLSSNAKDFLKVMRIQLEADLRLLNDVLYQS